MYCTTKQGPNTEPPQTMGATLNNESTITTEPPHWTDSSLSQGVKCILLALMLICNDNQPHENAPPTKLTIIFFFRDITFYFCYCIYFRKLLIALWNWMFTDDPCQMNLTKQPSKQKVTQQATACFNISKRRYSRILLCINCKESLNWLSRIVILPWKRL